ncbi:MAG: ABC transporter ATP-binding protein [Bacteroidales bacterium]|nr:ABC transporter ATP-binding protein [Bacteroidales bacterium]
MVKQKIVEVKNLTKIYTKGGSKTAVLDNISFELLSGEDMVIVGPSGSGKSTLLHILGGLDTPTSGQVFINGECINDFSDEKLSLMRNQKIGFVFQFFHLIDYLTAEENVVLPLILSKTTINNIKDRAEKLLEMVGLKNRANHYPNELSGGEMQRVAIARALINEPKLILADEPTGNLDKNNAQQVIEILGKVAKEREVSVIMVTHDENLPNVFKNKIKLEKGEIIKLI